jgi:hypothetical protein
MAVPQSVAAINACGMLSAVFGDLPVAAFAWSFGMRP